MSSETTAATFYLAKIGQMTSLFLNLSPFPAFMVCDMPHAEKMQKLDSISYLFLLFGSITNMVWLAYGYNINNQDIVLNNIFGLILSLILLISFTVIKRTKDEIVMIFVLTPMILAIFVTQVPVSICGIFASILSITCSLTPLEKIPLVIESKDHRFINFPLSLCSFFNSTVWCLYGYFSSDVFVVLCSFIGLQSAGIQLIFYAWANKLISSETWYMKSLITFFSLKKKDILQMLYLSTDDSEQMQSETIQLKSLAMTKNQDFDQQGESQGIITAECLNIEDEMGILHDQSLKSYNTMEYVNEDTKFQKQEKNESSDEELESGDYCDEHSSFKILGANEIKISILA